MSVLRGEPTRNRTENRCAVNSVTPDIDKTCFPYGKQKFETDGCTEWFRSAFFVRSKFWRRHTSLIQLHSIRDISQAASARFVIKDRKFKFSALEGLLYKDFFPYQEKVSRIFLTKNGSPFMFFSFGRIDGLKSIRSSLFTTARPSSRTLAIVGY